MRVARSLPRRRGAEDGQALVEFALVIPVFLFILFGLLDVGRLVYTNSTLSQAAREGARLAAAEAGWIGVPIRPASATRAGSRERVRGPTSARPTWPRSSPTSAMPSTA